jgi:hypothetical protein
MAGHDLYSNSVCTLKQRTPDVIRESLHITFEASK